MRKCVCLSLAVALVVIVVGVAMGQGKGNGRGNGGGNGKGNRESVTDKIPNIGRDDNSKRAQGKGKKQNSIERTSDNEQKGKGKSNRFKGLAKKSGVPQEVLQGRYELEKRLNPDLTYGQFVAAHMIAKKHSGVSTDDILIGLRNGQSIGQVLQSKGWDRSKIEKERKRIRNDRDKENDRDYEDDDRTWRLPL